MISEYHLQNFKWAINVIYFHISVTKLEESRGETECLIFL